MTEFESCDRASGDWIAFSYTSRILRMWVRRISDPSQFQLLEIMLFSDMEVDYLKAAVHSLAVVHPIVQSPLFSPETNKSTCYVTDHKCDAKWVTAENNQLVMTVRRNHDLGKINELRIMIKTKKAWDELVQAIPAI